MFNPIRIIFCYYILQIGFNAGDQTNALNHPDSLTSAILELEGESLTYRIDCKHNLHVHTSITPFGHYLTVPTTNYYTSS